MYFLFSRVWYFLCYRNCGNFGCKQIVRQFTLELTKWMYNGQCFHVWILINARACKLHKPYIYINVCTQIIVTVHDSSHCTSHCNCTWLKSLYKSLSLYMTQVIVAVHDSSHCHCTWLKSLSLCMTQVIVQVIATVHDLSHCTSHCHCRWLKLLYMSLSLYMT